MSSHLLGVTEVARLLGVSRQRVIQIARAYADFPEPVVVLSTGRVWSRRSIEAWIRRHPDRSSGRPKRKA